MPEISDELTIPVRKVIYEEEVVKAGVMKRTTAAGRKKYRRK